ncbi:MAG: hypothetical protein IT210_18650 [Armatimonadetes bacterium]|nr:hypothetical protein [Armatimonadota bacterium]
MPGWHTVGWHDIVFQTPADWNVTALTGTAKSGYLRVDSPESLSFQVKWDTPRLPGSERMARKVKALLRRQSLPEYVPDIGVVLDHYETVLRKQSRRSRQPLRLERKRPGKLAENRSGTAFSWRADRKATGWVWFCPNCRRVVIAEVVGEMSDPVSAMAARILPTLSDHAGDEGHRWGLYDLVVTVPDGLTLDQYKLMNVYVDLAFSGRPGTLWVTGWGLANLALKDRSLGEWFRANCTGRFKEYTYRIADAEFRGHPAVRLQGLISGVLPVAKAIYRRTFLQPSMGRLEALAWHCEAENKIYVVGHAFQVKSKLNEVAESVVCHSEVQGRGSQK